MSTGTIPSSPCILNPKHIISGYHGTIYYRYPTPGTFYFFWRKPNMSVFAFLAQDGCLSSTNTSPIVKPVFGSSALRSNSLTLSIVLNSGHRQTPEGVSGGEIVGCNRAFQRSCQANAARLRPLHCKLWLFLHASIILQRFRCEPA